MKNLILALLLCLPIISTQAQSIFVRDNQVVNLTLGVGRGVPLEASYEICIADNLFDDKNCSLGIGGYLGWTHYTERYDGIRHHNNSYRFGVRVAIQHYFV